MNIPKLILHCGAEQVDRADLAKVVTPAATETWQPIDHDLLVKEVEKNLGTFNLRVAAETHALTKNGNRYFGLFRVENCVKNDDYGYVVGIRNSHDKCFPAGLVVGSSVFVCDNLAFSGEIQIARKHTRHILQDLPRLTSDAVGRLAESWHKQSERFEAYKQFELTDSAAHDVVIRALDARACVNQQIPKILKEWRKPKHEAFEPRNAWSLFNAFTEVYKGSSLDVLPDRSQRLHGLLDHTVGLN